MELPYPQNIDARISALETLKKDVDYINTRMSSNRRFYVSGNSFGITKRDHSIGNQHSGHSWGFRTDEAIEDICSHVGAIQEILECIAEEGIYNQSKSKRK